MRTKIFRLLHDAGMREMPALTDDLGDLRDLAAEDAFEPRPEAAHEAQRMHAVADHKLARREALEAEAIDLVSRQSGHDGHRLLRGVARASSEDTARWLPDAAGPTCCPRNWWWT